MKGDDHMSDYISRQAIINAIANTIVNGESLGYVLAEEIVSEIPPVENKGEWKCISPTRIYECSCCGQHVMTSDIKFYKFCHGCGADMGGE